MGGEGRSRKEILPAPPHVGVGTFATRPAGEMEVKQREGAGPGMREEKGTWHPVYRDGIRAPRGRACMASGRDSALRDGRPQWLTDLLFVSRESAQPWGGILRSWYKSDTSAAGTLPSTGSCKQALVESDEAGVTDSPCITFARESLPLLISHLPLLLFASPHFSFSFPPSPSSFLQLSLHINFLIARTGSGFTYGPGAWGGPSDTTCGTATDIATSL